MSTTHRPVTAQQLFAMPGDGFRYDLVDGELRKMSPAGSEHGAIIMNIAAPLAIHVQSNSLGRVFGAETGFKLSSNPDTVLGPDVSFVRKERIPSRGLPKAFFPGPPDLAVEVISPDDNAIDVEEKVHKYLKTGTRTVCTVNPKLKTVSVYRSATAVTILTIDDVLEIPEVLPGFSLPVKKIFE